MERDIEFMRELLLKIQQADHGIIPISPKKMTNDENGQKKFAAHRDLLINSGYVELSGPSIMLTERGHDFLMLLEDKEILQKTKQVIENFRGAINLANVEKVAKKMYEDKLNF